MQNEIQGYKPTDEERKYQVIDGDLFVPDQYYESSNDLEIPDLRLDMQAKYVERPFLLFGEQKRTLDMQGSGVLHFYCDDYRYGMSLYEHPEKILRHNPSSIVEPNYSLYQDTPIAFGMQAVYKKRFIARAMQDRGIKIFVDLNVAAKFYKLNLIGVPAGWSAFCTRGYSDRLNYLAFELEIARSVAGDNPLTFVVYGGGERCRQFCKEHGLIYITPTVTIKKRAKALEAIKDTVAFFGQEVKIDRQLPTKEDIFSRQVENFSQEKLMS